MEKGLGVEMKVPTVSGEGPPAQAQVSSEPDVACVCHRTAAEVSMPSVNSFCKLSFAPLFNLFVFSLTHVNRYVMSIQCEPETNRSPEDTPGSQREVLLLMECVHCRDGSKNACVRAKYTRPVNIPVVSRYLL